MSDPLLEEARKAVKHFNLHSARLNAMAAAKLHGVSADQISEGELEVREALRAMMMALPKIPAGTHGLIATAMSPCIRALSLMERLRATGTREPAEPPRVAATPYYIEKD